MNTFSQKMVRVHPYPGEGVRELGDQVVVVVVVVDLTSQWCPPMYTLFLSTTTGHRWWRRRG